jgi:hypothetical protein
MTTRQSSHFSLNKCSDAIVSLALATLIAGIVIAACRWTTHVMSFDRAELDGIAFLAGIYWILSVVGYFVPRAAKSLRARGGAAAADRVGIRTRQAQRQRAYGNRPAPTTGKLAPAGAAH